MHEVEAEAKGVVEYSRRRTLSEDTKRTTTVAGYEGMSFGQLASSTNRKFAREFFGMNKRRRRDEQKPQTDVEEQSACQHNAPAYSDALDVFRKTWLGEIAAQSKNLESGVDERFNERSAARP